jgi:hypothetical protein
MSTLFSSPYSRVIPLWVKLCYTLFVAILVPVYWWYYGPANFLWGSDIALLVTLLGLWLGSSLLVSMMAVAVVIADTLWAVDFAIRAVVGEGAFGFSGTHYMFNPDIPLFVRSLSLFHVALPLVLLWAIHRLGYHRRALLGQTLISWIVFPVSYLVSDPEVNINWVYGFGVEPQQWMPEPLYVLLLMVLFPLILFLPTHLLLRRLFSMNNKR